MRLQLSEQIWLDLSPASFGSRGVAFLIDSCLRGLVFFCLLLAFYGGLDPVWSLVDADGLGPAIAIMLYFLVDWVYALLFEVRFDGVSPGKKLLGLRVVDRRGLPITWRRSFLRNLLNPLDIAAGGVTALVSMVVSEKSQRLGDLVAGTMVVYEADRITSDQLETSGDSIVAVPADLFAVMQQFCSRHKQLAPEARAEVIEKIYDTLSFEYLRAGLRAKAPAPKNQEKAIAWIVEQLKRVSPSDQVNWDSINGELLLHEKQFKRFSSKELTSHEIKAVISSYNSLCNTYAFLNTSFPNTFQSKFASALLRKARRLIYGRRLDSLDKSSEGFFERARAQYDLIKYHVALSALLFVGSAALAALFVQINPELGWTVIDEAGAAALQDGELWTDNIKGESGSAAAMIMTNNIKVSFLAFAGGVSAGIMTVVTIIFNGVHLGSIFAVLGQYNMDFRLLDFIVAHGILELSIIVVAGGAGFYLGDAIINPGEVSRAKALTRNANNILDLLLFNAACLILAGLVEGYVSPYPVGFTSKLLLGLLIGILYWVHLFEIHKLPRVFKSR